MMKKNGFYYIGIWFAFCIGVVIGLLIDDIPFGVLIGMICSAAFNAIYKKFKKPTDMENEDS